jgi:hypothetical protein
VGALNELKAEIKPVYLSLRHVAKWSDCPRCHNGAGRIDAFSHVKGGVCFKCNGKGIVAGNDAARKAARMNQLYASIKRSWQMGIRQIEPLPATKELRELLDSLPEKYQRI